MDQRELTFLKYGISSSLITRILKEKLTVSSIRKISNKLLIEKFNLQKDEVKYIKNCIIKKPVDKNVVNNLLINNNFTCCCCLGQKSNSFIIHHIEEYENTQDNSYENLAVLCPTCHDLAHSPRMLSLTISKEQLKLAKSKWESASILKRKGIFEVSPLYETWQTNYTYYIDDSELNYLFDLTLEKNINLVRGYFNIIYSERGNIFLAGEFSYTPERIDIDAEISYWEMQWGIRSSKIFKSDAILYFKNEGSLIWRNLGSKIADLPIILELNKIT
jgi:hypothetical protein